MKVDTELLGYFQAALDSDHGVKVLTDDPQRAIQKFQQFRRALGRNEFDQLVIAKSRSNPEGEIWIVNQKEESDGAPQPTAAEED